MSSSTPSDRARSGTGRSRTSRAAGTWILGADATTRSAILSAAGLAAIHGVWALVCVHAASTGAMSNAALYSLLGILGLCIFGTYACLRSGRTAGLPDANLVLPQILWSSAAAAIGYAVAPTLRPALLQAMCMLQIFGFFGLRPRQLAVAGGSTIAMLCAVLVLGGMGLLTQWRMRDELYPALLTLFVLATIMEITIRHSRRRGTLQRQKRELDAAVTAIRDLVIRDTLTGLYNRRHMQELLTQEHARAVRGGTSFAVALLDLDHFKRINDTHGHAIGDEVLRRFAELATSAMRASDTVARWGGEEFLVLMPETTTVDDAREPVDRLHADIGRLGAASLIGRLGVTFSAGVAFHQHGAPAEQVVASADRALYAAKAGGRNRSLVDPLASA